MENSNKNSEVLFEKLLELLESCITEADWSEHTKKFNHLYEYHSEYFEEVFTKILMLTLGEVKRSNDISKIFRFLSECMVALDNTYKADNKKDEDENDEEPIHPLMEYLFSILIKWSEAGSYIVRFQSCQLLNAVLSYMLDYGVGELDASIYEKIADLVQKRRLDINATVRSHAVLLAKYFQDPSDHEDPIIAGLRFQMECDPNARVRQNIVEIIAVCEETISSVYKRFLYDKNAQVRNSALTHICTRISPRAFTTEQRIRIINSCFTDASAAIRKTAVQKVIPVWLRAYNDKVTVLFQHILLKDTTVEDLPFADDLLLAVLKCVKLSLIVKELELNDETLLPTTLSPVKIFLWHRIYNMSCKSEVLRKYFPSSETLIEFLMKHLCDSASDKDQKVVFTELVMFSIDVLKTTEKEKCERLMPTVFEIIKSPFFSNEIIADAIALYLKCAELNQQDVVDDLLQITFDMQKIANFMTGQEKTQIMTKCICILFETLSSEYVVSLSEKMIELKGLLILPHLKSEEPELKTLAFKALTSYCLLDKTEAKNYWPEYSNAFYIEPSELKLVLLKGIYDLLLHYSLELFDEDVEMKEETLDNYLKNMQSHVEDNLDEQEIMVKGTLKLFLSHHTSSPVVLSGAIIPMFHPTHFFRTKSYVKYFLKMYGKTREEAECLTKAFLTILDKLFECPKNSAYNKVNLKDVSLELMEYAAGYENSKNFSTEEKFKDFLGVKLTKKFLKYPSRIQILDLQAICLQTIPTNEKNLLKLQRNVKMILDNLQSATFKPKNLYSKKSIKFFTTYLKKIQDTYVNGRIRTESNEKIRTESNEKIRTDSNEKIRTESNSDIVTESNDKITTESNDEIIRESNNGIRTESMTSEITC